MGSIWSSRGETYNLEIRDILNDIKSIKNTISNPRYLFYDSQLLPSFLEVADMINQKLNDFITRIKSSISLYKLNYIP